MLLADWFRQACFRYALDSLWLEWFPTRVFTRNMAVCWFLTRVFTRVFARNKVYARLPVRWNRT